MARANERKNVPVAARVAERALAPEDSALQSPGDSKKSAPSNDALLGMNHRRQTVGDTDSQTNGPDPEERRRNIAEAAYYRALRRGFEPGREDEDWIEAEKQIDGGD